MANGSADAWRCESAIIETGNPNYTNDRYNSVRLGKSIGLTSYSRQPGIWKAPRHISCFKGFGKPRFSYRG